MILKLQETLIEPELKNPVKKRLKGFFAFKLFQNPKDYKVFQNLLRKHKSKPATNNHHDFTMITPNAAHLFKIPNRVKSRPQADVFLNKNGEHQL